MHQRHASNATVVALIVWLASGSALGATSCLQDLNGDGFTDAIGETASCATTVQGELCPISAAQCAITETCPLDPMASCVAGSCQVTTNEIVPGTCVDTTNLTDPTAQYYGLPQFTCAETGVPYVWIQQPTLAIQVCESQCKITQPVQNTAACTVSNPTCPLGAGYACMDQGGTFQCSANTCTDLTLNPPIATPTDTRMLVDDGARGADGSCQAQMSIFGGRSMQCKVEGTKSAFQNCCAKSDEVISDSMTGLGNAGSAYKAIQALYVAGEAGWAAYNAMIIGGETVANAAAAHSLAFTNALVAAGPAILVGVAVVLIATWVANACDATDLETSMMANSKMCHYLGKKCIEKWGASCVQRAEVHCCFNSKLARIVQEQGRPQLKSFSGLPGSVFGTVDAPVCRGFDPTEFQSLDFSKIDLSEYFDDVTTAAASTIKITNTITTEVEGKVNALP